MTPEQQAALRAARTAGVDKAGLEQFASMIGASADGVALPDVSDVAATLRGLRDLTPNQREAVLTALHKNGHVTGDLTNRALFASAARPGVELKTPIQACAESKNNLVLIENIRARCRRIGFDLKMNEIVDPFALNEALSKAGMSSEDRIALKTDLAKLSLIA